MSDSVNSTIFSEIFEGDFVVNLKLKKTYIIKDWIEIQNTEYLKDCSSILHFLRNSNSSYSHKFWTCPLHIRSGIKVTLWIVLFIALILYEISASIFLLNVVSCLPSSYSLRVESCSYNRSWASQPSTGYLKGSDRKCSALHILTFPVSDRFRIVFANTPRTLSVNQEGWSRVTLNDRRTPWARTRNSSMLSFEDAGWTLNALEIRGWIPAGEVY